MQHENNESKIIRTITLDRGLDSYLWNKAIIKGKMKDNSKLIGEEVDDKILDERVKKIVDLRSLREKFYERGSCSLNIEPANLKNYHIKVKVSKRVPTPHKNKKTKTINFLNQTLLNYILYYNADNNSTTFLENILEVVASDVNSDQQLSQKILIAKSAVPKLI